MSETFTFDEICESQDFDHKEKFVLYADYETVQEQINQRDERIKELEDYRDKREVMWVDCLDNQKARTKRLAALVRDLKEDAQEAISTTWRFIGAYKKENAVPISGALRSAEYHLKQADWIFEPHDKHAETIQLAKEISEGK